jgi:hypothetical protein
MRPASFMTTVGSTGAGRDGRDVILTHEPETGATLRTRGRAYLLCEVDPPSQRGREIAAEVIELARHEYYYDLSAGIEVALRRALRKANRRASQLVRELRGRVALHAAVAVVVNNEVYAARIGKAHVFLVRHARLFLPGDEPDELADFVHRTTTRQASSLGAEPDLLPLVWRQTIDAGDTVLLASGSVVDALGAEALKNAAITLHPRAAAEHIHNRFVAEAASGSDATIFIEVAPSSGAAARVASGAEAVEAIEVEIAETIRSRMDTVLRHRPRPTRILAAIVRPFARAFGRAVAVALELLPRRRTALPKRGESARRRTARVQRLTTLLALLLVFVTIGIARVVVEDFQANQVVNDYRLAIVSVETDIAASRSFAGREDTERAWEKLDAASTRLTVAARSPAADSVRVTQLRDEIRALEDRLNDVLIDLAKLAPTSAPVRLTQTPAGLYAADPAAGRLWRLFDEEPIQAGVVLQRGQRGVTTPLAVVPQGEALLTIDDGRKLWRAEGNTVVEVPLPGSETWKGVTDLATFAGNVYILDGPSGQLWRYEPDFQGKLDGPVPFLPAPLPADAARGLAVDGDIWILTSSGELQRYRRQGLDRALTRLPFEPRWTSPPRLVRVQAIETQRWLWLLDASSKTVIQLGRDGREIARFPLPQRLAEPTAFFVSEGQQVAYTVHGSKIAATDVSR